MQNVLTISLSSPSLPFGYSIHPPVCSFLALLPSCSLLCLLALVTFPSVYSPSTNLVLISFLPSDRSPCTFSPHALDIQTLPRVYFFDSYATLQANGSDSRFRFSSVRRWHSSLPPLFASLLCFLSAQFLIAVCLFFVIFYSSFSWYSCYNVAWCYILLVLFSYCHWVSSIAPSLPSYQGLLLVTVQCLCNVVFFLLIVRNLPWFL